MSKSFALLHLLSKVQYNRALLMNVWDEIFSVFELHCEHIIRLDCSAVEDLSENENYDLIVACVNSSAALRLIELYAQNSKTEIILMTENTYTYNRQSQVNFQSFNINYKNANSNKIHKKLTKACFKTGFSKHTPFPDFLNTEQILTDKNLSLYRRYWIWRNYRKFNRGILSFVFEYFFVCIIKTSLGAPFSIFKLR